MSSRPWKRLLVYLSKWEKGWSNNANTEKCLFSYINLVLYSVCSCAVCLLEGMTLKCPLLKRALQCTSAVLCCRIIQVNKRDCLSPVTMTLVMGGFGVTSFVSSLWIFAYFELSNHSRHVLVCRVLRPGTFLLFVFL